MSGGSGVGDVDPYLGAAIGADAPAEAGVASPTVRGFAFSRHSPMFLVVMACFLHTTAIALVLTPLTDLVADKVYKGDLQQAALFISILEGVVALMQFFFDPWWGHLSDDPRVGRKPFLLLAFVELAVESFVLYAYPTWWSIVLVSLARGVCGVGFTMMSISIMDLTGAHPILAPKYLGYYGAASGLGLITGALGGVLIGGAFGIQYPFLISGIVDTCNVLWTLWLIPSGKFAPEAAMDDHLDDDGEPVSKEVAAAAAAAAASASGESSLPTTPLGSRSRSESVAGSIQSEHDSDFDHSQDYNPFLSLRILAATPTLLWFSAAFFIAVLARSNTRIFLLFMKYMFGWEMVYNGLFLAFVGVLASVVQGVALRVCMKAWGEEATIWVSLAFNLAGMLAYSFLPQGMEGAILLYAVTAFTCLAFLLLPILRAILSREVSAAAQGLLGGAAASLYTAANLAGSVAYGPLFAYFTSGPTAHAFAPEHNAKGAGGVPEDERLPTLSGAPFAWPGVPFFFSFLCYLAVVPILLKGFRVQRAAVAEREHNDKVRKKQASRRKDANEHSTLLEP